MIYDIQLMKELGFNTLRKHIKGRAAALSIIITADLACWSGGIWSTARGLYDAGAISLPLIFGNAHRTATTYFAREGARAGSVCAG